MLEYRPALAEETAMIVLSQKASLNHSNVNASNAISTKPESMHDRMSLTILKCFTTLSVAIVIRPTITSKLRTAILF